MTKGTKTPRARRQDETTDPIDFATKKRQRLKKEGDDLSDLFAHVMSTIPRLHRGISHDKYREVGKLISSQQKAPGQQVIRGYGWIPYGDDAIINALIHGVALSYAQQLLIKHREHGPDYRCSEIDFLCGVGFTHDPYFLLLENALKEASRRPISLREEVFEALVALPYVQVDSEDDERTAYIDLRPEPD